MTSQSSQSHRALRRKKTKSPMCLYKSEEYDCEFANSDKDLSRYLRSKIIYKKSVIQPPHSCVTRYGNHSGAITPVPGPRNVKINPAVKTSPENYQESLQEEHEAIVMNPTEAGVVAEEEGAKLE